MPSRNLADDVVGRLVGSHAGNRIQQDGKLALCVKRPLQQRGVSARDGEGGSIGGAGDVLCVQRCLIDLTVAARLYRDDSGGALQVCLIDGIINPPFIPLIDVHQHQLALDILSLIIEFCALSDIDKGEGGSAVGDKVRLVGAELYGLGGAILRVEGQYRPLELPCVNPDRILVDLGKAQGTHRVG